VELVVPAIVKKDGKRQPFLRDKVLRSLRIACSKRPVSDDQLDELALSIEQELSLLGEKEVPSQLIGEKVMAHLKKVDEVAYVRFASVYKSFRDIDEFMAEVGSLVRTRPESEPE
jgi:transcriptional repressor NrdR